VRNKVGNLLEDTIENKGFMVIERLGKDSEKIPIGLYVKL